MYFDDSDITDNRTYVAVVEIMMNLISLVWSIRDINKIAHEKGRARLTRRIHHSEEDFFKTLALMKTKFGKQLRPENK